MGNTPPGTGIVNRRLDGSDVVAGALASRAISVAGMAAAAGLSVDAIVPTGAGRAHPEITPMMTSRTGRERRPPISLSVSL